MQENIQTTKQDATLKTKKKLEDGLFSMRNYMHFMLLMLFTATALLSLAKIYPVLGPFLLVVGAGYIFLERRRFTYVFLKALEYPK